MTTAKGDLSEIVYGPLTLLNPLAELPSSFPKKPTFKSSLALPEVANSLPVRFQSLGFLLQQSEEQLGMGIRLD